MRLFPVSQGLVTVAVAVTSTAWGVRAASEATTGNPLATSDQQELDALAIQIYQDYPFTVLKAEAKVAYQTAHGLPISDEAASSLNASIEELVFSAVQKAVNNDPYHPKVYWVDSGPRSWFGLDVPGGRYSYDNPDCIYRTIPINNDVDYVVTGYRHSPGPTDVSFSLISDPNSQNTVAYLAGSDLIVDSDGSYTITINSSAADGQTNHIQSTSSAVQLLIRNNLGDWNTETPDNITVQAESIVDYGVGALGLKTTINAVNTLSAPSQSSSLGTLTSQASSFGHFNLTAEEALVATLTPGPADYFVFPVTNPWMITVDPGSSLVSLNSKQAVANTNGTYTFVVSLDDPGVYNWVNTTGLHEGTIMARWQGLNTSSSSADSLAIDVQVVAVSDLASVLPEETRYVTAEERAAQLDQRATAYSRRLEY
ncbi:hypothetical protein BDV30DRAFT_235841 [Aspergillus minisclerotigenes]|uniref:DUF1214 domain-containing protein n=1 Tax=Aspergillus minisclerotigenes TaxID=656917 RepID=A0A5N6JDM7_9EURO|nr:hypothetical protein BDV30DRAFT_235841 [Aspergillus minisclerotigenes]